MIVFRQISKKVALVRFGHDINMDDVAKLSAQVQAHLADCEHAAVYTVDCRGVKIFPPQIAEALIGLMKADNPMVERTAVLVTKDALFSMQVERMMREAGNPARRSFFEMSRLLKWLGEAASQGDCSKIAEICAVPLDEE